MKTISVQNYEELRADNVPHVLLDVRENDERTLCVIENDVHIPLGEIGSRHSELDPDSKVIIYCRSGVRSSQAARFLETVGFDDVYNLEGGILAWGKEIDQSIKPY